MFSAASTRAAWRTPSISMSRVSADSAGFDTFITATGRPELSCSMNVWSRSLPRLVADAALHGEGRRGDLDRLIDGPATEAERPAPRRWPVARRQFLAHDRRLRAKLTAVQNVVVVGASLAGLRACETLRTDGFTGRVTLIGAEDEVPYDRPPLSKKLLGGEWEPDRIRLRKADDFAGLDLDLRLGRRAVSLDVAAQRVQARRRAERPLRRSGHRHRAQRLVGCPASP